MTSLQKKVGINSQFGQNRMTTVSLVLLVFCACLIGHARSLPSHRGILPSGVRDLRAVIGKRNSTANNITSHSRKCVPGFWCDKRELTEPVLLTLKENAPVSQEIFPIPKQNPEEKVNKVLSSGSPRIDWNIWLQ